MAWKITKDLLLLRHAKSSWDDEALDDFDRPLAARGRKAAHLMAGWLSRHKAAPDLVLCSAALRTVQTLDLVRPALPAETKVKIERGLYLASADQLLARIRRTDPAVGRLMLIGHNPGMEELAVGLAAGTGRKSARMHEKFPTAALAWLRLRTGWDALQPGGAELLHFVRPADLEEREGVGGI